MEIKSADTGTQYFQYDNASQLTQYTDQLGRTTLYTYDSAGDLTSVKTPDTGITTYTYDPTFNYLATETDPLGRVTTYVLMIHLVSLVSITNPLGEITTYIWAKGQSASALTPPTLANPGSQSSFVGDNVSLQLAATDPAGVPLVYQASGLPSGLSLSSTGLIYGTITASGTPTITITVSDGVTTTSPQTFTWTVSAAPSAIDHFTINSGCHDRAGEFAPYIYGLS